MKKKQKMTIEKIKEEADKPEVAKVPKEKEMETYELNNIMESMIKIAELKKSPEQYKKVVAALEKKKNAINSIEDLHKAHEKLEE